MPQKAPDTPNQAKYSHYYKSVAHLDYIDVYRVLQLFGVTDQTVGHAIKKLLCAGSRGVKDFVEDITQARDTLNRTLEMYNESRAWEVPQAVSSTKNPFLEAGKINTTIPDEFNPADLIPVENPKWVAPKPGAPNVIGGPLNKNPLPELAPPTQEEFAKLQELIKKSERLNVSLVPREDIVVIQTAMSKTAPNAIPLVPLTASARIVREVQNVAGCSMKEAKEMTTQAIIYFNKGGVQSAITYLAGVSTQAQQIWDAIEKIHAFECGRMHQAVLILAEYTSTDVDVLKIRDAIQAAMSAYNVSFQGGASSDLAIRHGTNWLMDTLKQKEILGEFDIEHDITFNDLFTRIVDILQ